MRRTSSKRLVDQRYRKFRQMGRQPVASRRESFSRDMDELQKRFGSALGQVLDLLPIRDGSSRESADRADDDEAEMQEPTTTESSQ